MVGSWFLSTTSLAVAAAGRRDPQSVGLRVERFDSIDFGDPPRLAEHVEAGNEPALVNFAARTDVDGVEKERPTSGGTASGHAWTVNSDAVRSIARAASRSNKYLVQISTDFVFDGQSGPYDERASRSTLSSRLSWYGWTKSEGERAIEESGARAAIVRIAYPYGPRRAEKADLPHWIVEAWRGGCLPPLYTDQWFTPTWIPDIPVLLERLLREQPSGIFHLASPTLATPFELGTALLGALEGQVPGLSPGSISGSGTSRRAPRPIHGGLSCARVAELGIAPTRWQEGIQWLVEEEGRV